MLNTKKNRKTFANSYPSITVGSFFFHSVTVSVSTSPLSPLCVPKDIPLRFVKLSNHPFDPLKFVFPKPAANCRAFSFKMGPLIMILRPTASLKNSKHSRFTSSFPVIWRRLFVELGTLFSKSSNISLFRLRKFCIWVLPTPYCSAILYAALPLSNNLIASTFCSNVRSFLFGDAIAIFSIFLVAKIRSHDTRKITLVLSGRTLIVGICRFVIRYGTGKLRSLVA